MVENLKIYKDASELIKRVFIIVKQFPRDYKFTLGTRIQNTALDCIDLIYRASRHQPCRDAVINFWKNESSSFDLNDFFYYNKPNDHLMVRKIEINKRKFSYA